MSTAIQANSKAVFKAIVDDKADTEMSPEMKQLANNIADQLPDSATRINMMITSQGEGHLVNLNFTLA
jgi:D-alanine-D-alanine ligase-like ATP-grasp enzyme